MNLNVIHLQDLKESRTVSIEQNTAFTIEEQLDDASNENSGVMSYFQIGSADTKQELINSILMQYLDEPFFNDLRTQQQLGYVVYCRQRQHINIIGNGFMVQSPKKCNHFLVSKINDFLLDIKKKFENNEFTDEVFQTNKKSVLTNLKEKDKNLREQVTRFWDEIYMHEYNFDRQDQEIKEIENITKEDVINHFNSVFFSNKTKRLDYFLSSSKHSEDQASW